MIDLFGSGYGPLVIEGIIEDGEFRQTNGQSFDRWLAARDRAVKAEVWDEGYSAGKGEALDFVYGTYNVDPAPTANPYRANQIEGDNE